MGLIFVENHRLVPNVVKLRSKVPEGTGAASAAKCCRLQSKKKATACAVAL